MKLRIASTRKTTKFIKTKQNTALAQHKLTSEKSDHAQA